MRPLAIVGNVNVDLILGPIAPWPMPGTEVLCANDDLRIGGAAGNVALAWQAMNIPFQCAANTGDDHFGEWLRNGFGRVSRNWSKNNGATALSVGITHPNAERTFFSTLGHLPLLDWEHVDTQIDWAALAGGTLLLCGSFLTMRLAEDYDKLFCKARRNDVMVALDTGWPLQGWTDPVRHAVEAWVSRSDIVLLNEIEAINLTQQKDAATALDALLERMPKEGVAVVKRGANGAIAARHGATFGASAPTVCVNDTIGAGDIFNAAFLAERAKGAETGTALQAAVDIASIAISTDPRIYSTTPPQELTA